MELSKADLGEFLRRGVLFWFVARRRYKPKQNAHYTGGVFYKQVAPTGLPTSHACLIWTVEKAG